MALKKKMKWSGILILVIAALAYFYRSLPQEYLATPSTSTSGQLNRSPKHLAYSNHARCRMDCREIDEAEVRALLNSGKVNLQKSDLASKDPCKQRYALEGRSADGQQIRMIVASCSTTTTVITVIDLEEDWTCSCK